MIFLVASGALFAYFAVSMALEVRRRRRLSTLEAELAAVEAEPAPV